MTKCPRGRVKGCLGVSEAKTKQVKRIPKSLDRYPKDSCIHSISKDFVLFHFLSLTGTLLVFFFFWWNDRITEQKTYRRILKHILSIYILQMKVTFVCFIYIEWRRKCIVVLWNLDQVPLFWSWLNEDSCRLILFHLSRFYNNALAHLTCKPKRFVRLRYIYKYLITWFIFQSYFKPRVGIPFWKMASWPTILHLFTSRRGS